MHARINAAFAEHGALADPLADYVARFDETIRTPIAGSWALVVALRARGVGPASQRRHAHEATWPNIHHGVDLCHEVPSGAGGNALLG